MSRCNYCGFKQLKRRAEKGGLTVTKNSEPFHSWAGGVNVYAHPPEVDVGTLTKEEAEQYFKAWYAELPSHCCC